MSTPARSTPLPESPASPSGPEIPDHWAGPLGHLFPDEETGHIFVEDPKLAADLMAVREELGFDRKDEVWDGALVMSPQPNVQHQEFSGELHVIFHSVLPIVGGGKVMESLGVSDREKGWSKKNFRVPDVSVFLTSNPAKNCKTHMMGGPDFAVEVLSHRDPARRKLDFYAAINTREVLLIDRDPWALELYRLADGRLGLVGISTVEGPTPLASEVLPLTFRLAAGEERPTLEVARVGGDEVWRI